MLDKLKNLGPLYDKVPIDGKFLNKQLAGSLKSDFGIKSRERKQTSTLRDFADESMSEREDEDIYQHYMNKMKEGKLEKEQERKNLDK